MTEPTTLERNNITGLVLAGGQGTRMGGLDKGLIEFKGREMIAWVLDAFQPQVAEVVISANRNIDRYRGTGAQVVSDAGEGFAGPLAGIASGLRACPRPYLAVVPCDGPFVPADLVSRLGQAFETDGIEIAAAHDGERLHPTFALIDRTVLADLDAYLAEGGRKVQEFYFMRKFAQVDFSDCPGAFLNVNTPGDMERAGFGPGAKRTAKGEKQ
ncbi:MAG TPA: molybdenum cofactor guanylyltransferase MobA [Gammaproteobacteria bacterium]|nr:molybdenum cofactor guanylyltransferase MobA [Gammaproteobacteria bacterium]